jgi:hypothetical protein
MDSLTLACVVMAVGSFGIVTFVFFDRLKVGYYRWRVTNEIRTMRREQRDDFHEN